MAKERVQDRESAPQKVEIFRLQCIYKDDIPTKVRLVKIEAGKVGEEILGTLEEDILVEGPISMNTNGEKTTLPTTTDELTRMLESHFESSSVRRMHIVEGGAHILIITSRSYYVMTNQDGSLFRLRLNSYTSEEKNPLGDDAMIQYVQELIQRKMSRVTSSEAEPSPQTSAHHPL